LNLGAVEQEEDDCSTGHSASSRGRDVPTAGTLRLAGGAGVSFAGKVAGKIGHILLQVLFARLLGMEDFGRFALGMTLVRILGSIAPLGLIRAVVVFGAKYWRVDDARFKGVVHSTVMLTLVSGAVFAAVLAGWAGKAVELFGRSSLSVADVRMFALLVAPFALMRVAVEVTRISQRMQFAVLAEDMAQPLVSLLVFLGLYAFGARLSGAAVATGVSYILTCVLAFWFAGRLFPKALGREVVPIWEGRELITFAAPTSLSVICGVCCTMLDRLVVGSYRPPEDMALYQAAGQVSVAFTIILGSFTTIFGPMAARYYATGDLEELRKLVKTSTNWGLYLAVPLFVLLLVVPGPILRVTFGDAYGTGATTLVVLAAGQLFNVGTGSVGVLLVTSGNQNAWVFLSFLALITNGAVGVLLTPTYGIVGASIGNLFANVVLFGGGTLVAKARLDVWPYERRTLKIVVAGVLAGALGMAAEHLSASIHPIVSIVTVALTTATAFFGAVVVLGIDAEDRSLGRMLFQRLGWKSGC
jgi:O-antigen/teichoic acid export membrane protein